MVSSADDGLVRQLFREALALAEDRVAPSSIEVQRHPAWLKLLRWMVKLEGWGALHGE
jgi:hypothetical protein